MQSLATRAVEDKMLCHIRPSGKVNRRWDRRGQAVRSRLVKQWPFLQHNRGRRRQSWRVLNQSSFLDQIPAAEHMRKREGSMMGAGKRAGGKVDDGTLEGILDPGVLRIP